ncbi:hypothetical protein QEZ54_11130 [Catellatospora sp. KI3]|uniref:hypothetical protein n=1 Tax=Catellatospora sp. KI3 TaxID=3041620 RepID=UPI002482FB8A|nr:hypothetical protein [Catellatospora sp. KI3]MDI1461525.1 hypothetical protein [Catellatospora sp. KI3]
MARRHWAPLLLAAVIALGGCAGRGGEAAPGGGGSTDGDGLPRLRQQAQDALARYEAAVRSAGGGRLFVPVRPLTDQLGDWEPDNGDHKLALASGQIVAVKALPPGDARGKVVWSDGVTREYTLLTPAQAIAAIAVDGRGNDCGGCAPIEVTGAVLTAGPIETTQGTATVPRWEFTVKGSAVRIVRVAVGAGATVTVVPPSWDPYHAPGGLAVEWAAVSSDRSQLVAHFTGSPGPASQPCGVDYSTEAVESDTAVVVIVLSRPHAADETCASIGAARQAPVRLSRPLGERAVLEVVQGLPVPLTVTP